MAFTASFPVSLFLSEVDVRNCVGHRAGILSSMAARSRISAYDGTFNTPRGSRPKRWFADFHLLDALERFEVLASWPRRLHGCHVGLVPRISSSIVL